MYTKYFKNPSIQKEHNIFILNKCFKGTLKIFLKKEMGVGRQKPREKRSQKGNPEAKPREKK